ncbi:MAG: hypothetical protein KJ645_00080 [Planctomycetes bacterium]|nr:hypothetical protein [Planctomycetota bacterium]
MRARHWIGLLGFGLLWGLYELLAGSAFYKVHLPLSPVLLSIWALGVLACARGCWNARGSSTGIALVAAAIKALGSGGFFCHLLAIVLMGLAFDLAATFLLRSHGRTLWRTVWVGASSAYLGHALFAVTASLFFRNADWLVKGGMDPYHHIVTVGGLSALGALIVVPFGFKIGGKLPFLENRLPFKNGSSATVHSNSETTFEPPGNPR